MKPQPVDRADAAARISARVESTTRVVAGCTGPVEARVHERGTDTGPARAGSTASIRNSASPGTDSSAYGLPGRQNVTVPTTAPLARRRRPAASRSRARAAASARWSRIAVGSDRRRRRRRSPPRVTLTGRIELGRLGRAHGDRREVEHECAPHSLHRADGGLATAAGESRVPRRPGRPPPGRAG